MRPSLLFILPTAVALRTCKLTPSDRDWPSLQEWAALNSSIGGALLQTHPAASSCYRGNPLHSSVACKTVEANWTESAFHASLPESITSPLYANDSCLPPSATVYNATAGCALGGYPAYVVNATSDVQIAAAARWASHKNIRIVIKGTGHDLNGRSSGAHALSIWTRHLKHVQLLTNWRIPGSNETDAVLVAGSGLNYGEAVLAALDGGRVIVSGNDATVGLGGHIQGGGHGPLSSTHGLAADNIYQARVVTTQGDILTADATQNQDLLWAIRGGGAGQYGIVTEYVLKTHPAPATVVCPALSLSPADNTSAAYEASWKAFAVLLQDLPDLMDSGLAGSMIIQGDPKLGVSVSQGFYAYNMTASAAIALIKPTVKRMQAVAGSSTHAPSVAISTTASYSSYRAFFEGLMAGGSSTAGAMSMISSHLLGRAELSDLDSDRLVAYAKRFLNGTGEAKSKLAVIGLQGGPGPANVDPNMRGALLPAWRSTYIHAMSYSATFDTTLTPKKMLSKTAAQLSNTTEKLWREWAPNTGAYMNEGNPFTPYFKKDFYGASYDRLLEIKKKYDPTESLFVLSGVGSDHWDYDLMTGSLCRVD
ncbi:isoamyl alcohol oxidase, putative [Metarhizium acridum CQMa 102]|uniref:Isoamyl alcohol oxidase, putative n=1 Tax=Metarhizium acridum (strain CQMa 102) TaxID=655827 RepID=E9DX07_METAQ|nr:isoamyl alcohol oxidase, putative [Metarhizium acridum CQMa 102]EFY91870.1 isoamyl alcohol oxidase, putative [Metarhizium acridum CQMa 102]